MEAPSFGQIVEYDEENQTGIIEQYDGSRVIFHVKDMATAPEDMMFPRIGQSVLFRPDKNKLGSLQAYEIQIVG